ncbi:bifunctional 5,10-methylenetetrahydrofolate dehydrogenase/5,10-methenyltetrahydrofolate cyclohydrolase [Candidatus Peregrinibacteria bacterium]|nr:bifunctional 5,10-methylenetetrahydrofolate dehydrogenase/5,10-methenyltetrahydrofolate cyclohydrolase [Candidatus Peregrinibacteria bacterium]
MPAKILTGKEPADTLLESLKPLIKKLNPKLVIVRTGSDAGSDVYIRAKLKACERVGMRAEHRHLSPDVTKAKMLALIEELNSDADVTGFIIQTPLPEHLWKESPLLFRAIDPKKDVDGFTAYNLGKLFLAQEFEHLPPATPAGIITLLEYYNISVAGKHVVIVGRSNVVGKPLAMMLLHRDATVTICHSKTKNIDAYTQGADILIAATGKERLITGDMVKKGAVVIDVGITRTDAGLTGDVDFERVKEIASAITPVPGGVGPMTVASLLRNVVRAKERQTSSAPPYPSF